MKWEFVLSIVCIASYFHFHKTRLALVFLLRLLEPAVFVYDHGVPSSPHTWLD